MIKTSSNSVYDSYTTRGMAFKLLNAVLEGEQECGEDCTFFEEGQKEKTQVGEFRLKDVRGNDETIEFYIQPKSGRPGSAAYMLTKRENNGTMAVVFMIEDEMTFGEFIKKVQEDNYFSEIYAIIGHEVTHLREAEAKQRAYGKEEEERLEKLRNTDKNKYNEEYVNSEVEFESLMTSTIASAEAELISEASFRLSSREVEVLLDNIESGKTEKMVARYLMKMFQQMADRFKWNDKKRRKAYTKIIPASRYVAQNVKEHILNNVLKSRKK